MKRNRAAILLCMLWALATAAQAQQFKYETALKQVQADGFYKIVLGVDVLSNVKPDLRDLRIADKKKRFVPYILATQPVAPGAAFISLSIISNTIDTAGNSILDIENTTGSGIDQVSFVIKNTDVQRRLSISGSNDQGKWFIIREDLLLTPSVSYGSDEFMQSVAFPLSAYRYLRFVIRNNKSDALNIVRAGLLHKNTGPDRPVYSMHEQPAITQQDSSDGNSYIYIAQSKANLIEQLSIKVAGQPLYERSATLYQLSDSAGIITNTLYNFTLSSKSSREIPIPATVTRQLLLVVYNGDNLPLSVSDISLGYLPKTIITYLEKGKDYTMLLGAADAVPPNYDLEQFRDSIPRDIMPVAYGQLQSIVKEGNNKNDNSQAIIWMAIIGGIGLLGFFTYRLVKEMNEQKG